MRRTIVGLLTLLAMLAGPASASAIVTLTAPSADSSPYPASAIPVSYEDDNAGQSAQMDWSYTGGGQAATNDTWRISSNGTTDFTFAAADPNAAVAVTAVAPFNGAIGTSLPDGTYTVTLRVYAGADFTSLLGTFIETGVTIDGATGAPTLTTPAAAGQTSNPINVQYALPEAASTAQLTFVKTESTSRVLTLGGSTLTAGSHSINVDTTNLGATTGVTGVAGGTALPDGLYDYVVLSYQDAVGNTAATDSSANVVLDTVTQAPTFTSPSIASMWGSQLAIAYSLPEQAASAHLKLIFTPATGPATTLTLATAEEAAGAHSFFLDAKAMTATGPIGLIGGPTSLADGTYSVELRYSDLLGNPLSSVTHMGVIIDTVTAPPTLELPLAGSYSGETVPVTYTLGETAAFTSTRVEFVNGADTISVLLSDATTGAHTLTLNRSALQSSAGVLGSEGGTTLPDGTYTVRLRTQDVLSNPSAETAPRTVVLTSPTVDPGPDPDPAPATPDPDPVTEPTPPTTNSPVPTVGRLKLKLASKAVKAKNRRQLTATFKPWSGAKSYRFTAVIGSTTKTGTCKTIRKNIVCAVNAPRKGLWTLTVSALGAGKTVLATGTGKTRVTFKPRR